MTSRRVIVCGSRNWHDELTIIDALDAAWTCGDGLVLTLVHGACPTRADAIADEWADETEGVTVERHPADEAQLMTAAGAGADLLLAFRLDGSRGTTHMIERARARRIPSIVWDRWSA